MMLNLLVDLRNLYFNVNQMSRYWLCVLMMMTQELFLALLVRFPNPLACQRQAGTLPRLFWPWHWNCYLWHWHCLHSTDKVHICTFDKKCSNRELLSCNVLNDLTNGHHATEFMKQITPSKFQACNIYCGVTWSDPMTDISKFPPFLLASVFSGFHLHFCAFHLHCDISSILCQGRDTSAPQWPSMGNSVRTLKTSLVFQDRHVADRRAQGPYKANVTI